MLVASSFDLWQKDAFFSAAEEVQASADILDSAYRSWLKVKREQGPINIVDELHRELKTALGTAKWQLEEFESATRLSHGSCRDEGKATRHQQFVFSMETQILHIENELSKSLHEEGKQPLRWVNLDEEEKDDLAMFLSGIRKDESVNEVLFKLKEDDSYSNGKCVELQCESNGCSKDEIVIDMDIDFTNEPNVRELPGVRDEVCCSIDRTFGTRRTFPVPNYASLQIVVPDDNERWRTLAPCVEATPKVKGSRVWNSLPIRAVGWINQIHQCSSIIVRKMQSPRQLHCHLRFIQLNEAVLYSPSLRRNNDSIKK
ncbi:hypothetical protein V2J09_009599 [Rumex salicifolius]